MANRLGITSVVDAAVSPAMLDAYRAADAADELTLRVVAAQRIDPTRGPGQVDEMVARRDHVTGKRFRADAAKIFVDGEIERHTAAMLAPYADAPDERGVPLIEPDALDAIVRRLDAEGFSLHMHVMGDGAVRAGLDAIERAIAANGAPRERRARSPPPARARRRGGPGRHPAFRDARRRRRFLPDLGPRPQIPRTPRRSWRWAPSAPAPCSRSAPSQRRVAASSEAATGRSPR
jgi:hypothetical protein